MHTAHMSRRELVIQKSEPLIASWAAADDDDDDVVGQ